MKLAQILRTARTDKIPPGYYHIDDFARREGFSSSRSFSTTLAEAIRRRLVVRREFRVPWGKQTRLRPYYKRAA